MIYLDFLDASLSDEEGNELSFADSAILLHTYFVAPVRFSVKGVEMLLPSNSPNQTIWISGPEGVTSSQQSSSPFPWFPIPLLHVCTIGMECVESLRKDKEKIYKIPGGGAKITFTMSIPNIVEIHSTVSNKTVYATYEELTSSFSDFVQRVKQTLGKKAPSLAAHPYWKEWLVAN